MKYTHHHTYTIRIRYRSDSLTQKQIFWVELGGTPSPTLNDTVGREKKGPEWILSSSFLPSFLPSHREHLPKILVSCSSICIVHSPGFWSYSRICTAFTCILALQQHLYCIQMDLHLYCVHMYSCVLW